MNKRLSGGVAVLLAIASFAVSAQEEQFDMLTANCLAGYENDEHPRICAIVDPEMKDKVAEARRIWEARNARKLAELRQACDVRLARAYGNDPARIGEAKRAARQWREAYIAQSLARPDRHNVVNCFAYATDFAAGGTRIDIQQWLIDDTRNSPARPVKWPK